MQHLSSFILSEGDMYQKLKPASENIYPRKASGSPPSGLDGWSFMMRTAEKSFALLYFENHAVKPTLSEFKSNTSYNFQWFNPIDGKWSELITINSDENGTIVLPYFPDGKNPSSRDWAAKILED